jgi:hypothetical protein
MHTPSGGIAVVSTTLAGADRRALSQAWYSALHLAERAPVPAKRAPHAAAPPPPRRIPPPEHVPVGFDRPASVARPGAMAVARPVPFADERRRPPEELGRRIARVVARARPRRPAPAASLAVGGGRVHVFVRTGGGTTRIVALCSPALEARVARALAHVRFGLAAAGLRVEASA